MRKVLSILIILAAVQTAAPVANASGSIGGATRHQILSLVPGADLDNLSRQQIAALHGAMNGSGNNRTEQLRMRIRTILSWQ